MEEPYTFSYTRSCLFPPVIKMMAIPAHYTFRPCIWYKSPQCGSKIPSSSLNSLAFGFIGGCCTSYSMLPLLHNVCKFVFYLSFRVKIRLRLSGLCYFWSRDQLSSVTLRTGQECSELNLIAVRRNDFCYTHCYTMFGSSACRRYSLNYHALYWASWVWTRFSSRSPHLGGSGVNPMMDEFILSLLFPPCSTYSGLREFFFRNITQNTWHQTWPSTLIHTSAWLPSNWISVGLCQYYSLNNYWLCSV